MRSGFETQSPSSIQTLFWNAVFKWLRNYLLHALPVWKWQCGHRFREIPKTARQRFNGTSENLLIPCHILWTSEAHQIDLDVLTRQNLSALTPVKGYLRHIHCCEGRSGADRESVSKQPAMKKWSQNSHCLLCELAYSQGHHKVELVTYCVY